MTPAPAVKGLTRPSLTLSHGLASEMYAASQYNQQFHEKCEDNPIQIINSPIKTRIKTPR